MREFLDREKAQVWAVDRASREPRYIDVGLADALRETARSEWRCPFPGCDSVISTRGGSKRDHFWHPNGTPHVSDGESEAHLGAKAMLAAWAALQAPGGAAVEEEMVSLKEPSTALYRRADVMVTWPDRAKTAFEVEYKNFLVADWERKQADYDREKVACVWLLGHTRLRHRETFTSDEGVEIAAVRLSPLAGAWADAGRYVLVVNPVTRQIGTIAGDRAFTCRPNDWHDDVWLRLDALDDCDLDHRLGIVTPAMRLILAAEAEQVRLANEERRRAVERAEAQRLRDGEAARLHEEYARQAAERGLVSQSFTPADRDQYRLRKRRERAEAWTKDPFRQRCLDRWGRVPGFLAEELDGDHGVWASHERWHCLVFAHFVDSKPIGSTFKVREVYQMLARAQIELHHQGRFRAAAIQGFIAHLEYHGYVDIGAEVTDHMYGDITVLATTRQPPTISPRQRETASAREKEQRRQEQARVEARRARERRAAADAAERERIAQREAADKAAAERERRWHLSADYDALRVLFGKDIPAAITWPGGLHANEVDAYRAQWRMHVYMTHIYRMPSGSRFTLSDVVETLARHGVHAIPAHTPAEAVREYVANLMSRGYLERVADDIVKGENPVFTVIEDHARQETRLRLPAPRSAPPESPGQTAPLF
ncbi:hypothetical protein HNR19_000650 [Nocardioides thalensis]|uniref:Competence protein CoiA nuclease-like domain-containing protein n=1 Tax=Nocardioides thalensis TaxID=1914755 RepID=A0A853BZQ7_9ACTN|nr:competence protein CoiA family protein [Nocardioides thalensis]NYI99951.1 hypothetical protein [Nocardioides thalensis]